MHYDKSSRRVMQKNDPFKLIFDSDDLVPTIATDRPYEECTVLVNLESDSVTCKYTPGGALGGTVRGACMRYCLCTACNC